jgi:hypothetical protein
MANASLESRRALYGERVCTYAPCGRSFVPVTRRQATNPRPCCSKKCAQRHRVVLGLCVLNDPANGRKGGHAAAVAQRRAAIKALADRLGAPVSARDVAMYHLGRKHALDTQRQQDRERAPHKTRTIYPKAMLPRRNAQVVRVTRAPTTTTHIAGYVPPKGSIAMQLLGRVVGGGKPLGA